MNLRKRGRPRNTAQDERIARAVYQESLWGFAIDAHGKRQDLKRHACAAVAVAATEAFAREHTAADKDPRKVSAQRVKAIYSRWLEEKKSARRFRSPTYDATRKPIFFHREWWTKESLAIGRPRGDALALARRLMRKKSIQIAGPMNPRDTPRREAEIAAFPLRLAWRKRGR